MLYYKIMLKAVLFDVDGVLMDSKDAVMAMFQNLLKVGGYPPASRDEMLSCLHLTLRDSLKKLTESDNPKEIDRLWNLAHDKSMRSPELFEFPEKLEEVLEELHKSYRLAIVTSRIKLGVEEMFDVRNLGHLFDVVVTVEDYEHPKPRPEPLYVALERLGITADEAIYIGDSKTDIEAAKSAGMKSIHLSRDTHPDATAGIREFYELVDVIKELSGS